MMPNAQTTFWQHFSWSIEDQLDYILAERVKKNEKLRRELNERIWNQMEQEAEDDIKSGRMSGPFETVEELLRDLKEK